MSDGRAGAEEARAIAFLQQLASMCDETRRHASSDPARIADMLSVFEETLATLAPMLERIGASPNAARDAVVQAAKQAASSHQALIDAMMLELERLGRAIADVDNANSAGEAYASARLGGTRPGFQAVG